MKIRIERLVKHIILAISVIMAFWILFYYNSTTTKMFSIEGSIVITPLTLAGIIGISILSTRLFIKIGAVIE